MKPFNRVYQALRDCIARGTVTRAAYIRCAIREPSYECCVQSFTIFATEFPELWPDELPETDSDGIPPNARHRAILGALRSGPMKVEVLARAIGVQRAGRLYDEPGNIRHLVALELVELGEDGYSLTAKGKRVAASIAEE